MKTIKANEIVKIPEDVELWVKARTVKVKGPRGALQRTFKHLHLDMLHDKKARTLKIEMWFGNKKQLAQIGSLASHIENLITGVTQGFRYKMRFVYAHFPINATIPETGDSLEIRNFLGEKVVRTVKMLDGVKVARSAVVKDEIILEGNNIENVSQSAANIQQSVLVRNKDIRKFLDGIYVSEKGPIPVDE